MIQALKEALLRLPYKYLKGLYYLREKHDDIRASACPSQQKVFFIVGSQRSGTTLLRLILDSHPALTVYDEGEANGLIRSGRFARQGLTGFKVPRWTHRYEFLNRKHPAASYIFMKRDIRSIVASMLDLPFSGGLNWVEKFGVQEFDRSVAVVTNREVKNLFKRKYREIAKARDVLSLAVLCAYTKMYLWTEYKESGSKAVEVHYEKLVAYPRKTIARLLDFLEVPWNDNVLRHHQSHTGISIGKTDSTRKIDTCSIKKWERVLAREDVVRVNSLVGFLNSHLTRLPGHSPSN